MPENTAGGLAGFLQRGMAGSPMGGTINAFRDGGMRAGFTNLWNQSVPGRLFNGFRGLGDGIQGNGLAGFLGHGNGGANLANGVAAGPPTAAEQYGNPSSPDFVGPPEADAANPWMQWLAQHTGGSSSGRGFQGGGIGWNRAADRVATGAISNMGGSSLNPMLAGDTAGGLGRLMNSFNPWRQSGITFGDRQRQV